MTSIALPRKVFQGVAKRSDMFRLFDRHAKRPNRFDGDQSDVYAGEWFEIDEPSYCYMLDILPPLWMRGPIFAMREFMTGSVILSLLCAADRRNRPIFPHLLQSCRPHLGGVDARRDCLARDATQAGDEP